MFHLRCSSSPQAMLLQTPPATLATMAGVTYDVDPQTDSSLRIVVDHVRPVIQPIKISGLDGALALYHRLDEALPPASEPTA